MLMKTAREMMRPGAECVQSTDTAAHAAEQMTKLGVGALPICGADDNRLKGMLTDRDLVRKVMAAGKDATRLPAGELADGHVKTVGSDDSAEKVLSTMQSHGVKRLPVIDGKALVGVISLADVARALPANQVGEVLQSLSED